ncbi:hypothetical protein ACFX15_012731 [Malus domestica]
MGLGRGFNGPKAWVILGLSLTTGMGSFGLGLVAWPKDLGQAITRFPSVGQFDLVLIREKAEASRALIDSDSDSQPYLATKPRK